MTLPRATAGSRARDFDAVVVGAGSGSRFGGELPKQFHELSGRTVLEWAVRALAGHPAVAGVVVVLAPAELAGPRAVLARGWPGVSRVVAGGATRSESVRQGVAASGAAPFVLVHDAARPLVSATLVDAVVEATRRHGAAVPVVRIADTVKELDDPAWVERTVGRERLGLAQTPQGFRRDWLLAALERAGREGQAHTDEASAVERDGRRVAAVPGETGNLKITSRDDLAEARRRTGGVPELRVGSGFDIHGFGGDRPLVLGGVVFPAEPGLAGHSDADVVLHAGMDALLGAAGLADIGTLFPPGEPSLAGAPSTRLAEEVARRVRGAGFDIVNLDLTLLAEFPRISPRAGEMREAIGRCLGIDPGRVGLKATTLEGLGALGRREGIACQAACLLARRASGEP